MVDILYTENSSDCQLEVKLSNAMYPRSNIAPEKVVAADDRFPDGSAARRNRLTPTEEVEQQQDIRGRGKDLLHCLYDLDYFFNVKYKD